jgi:hypothetical protein
MKFMVGKVALEQVFFPPPQSTPVFPLTPLSHQCTLPFFIYMMRLTDSQSGDPWDHFAIYM